MVLAKVTFFVLAKMTFFQKRAILCGTILRQLSGAPLVADTLGH